MIKVKNNLLPELYFFIELLRHKQTVRLVFKTFKLLVVVCGLRDWSL